MSEDIVEEVLDDCTVGLDLSLKVTNVSRRRVGAENRLAEKV